MSRSPIIAIILGVQVLSAFFFVGNILSSVLGFAPIAWQLSEYIEVGAVVGLVLGIFAAGSALRSAHSRARNAEGRLRAVSGEFLELMQERFNDWGLTPAEKDVALFALKGLTSSEIAELRNTSEGTVKAQTNSIYRKAEVTGRPQLLSLFIDDLLDETALAEVRSNLK